MQSSQPTSHTMEGETTEHVQNDNPNLDKKQTYDKKRNISTGTMKVNELVKTFSQLEIPPSSSSKIGMHGKLTIILLIRINSVKV